MNSRDTSSWEATGKSGSRRYPRATANASIGSDLPRVRAEDRVWAINRLTNYSFDGDLAPGCYLVVDDIFDGGGTFALLAGAVPDGVALDLWVTHGGFTKLNFSAEARAPYRRIYTTDSLSTAVAAGLQDNQIQVTALQPWITGVLNPGLGAEQRRHPAEVGEDR